MGHQPELEEFLKQLSQCTEGVEEELNLLFREASRRMYCLTLFGVHQLRTYHAWVKCKVEPHRIITTGSSVKRNVEDCRGSNGKRCKSDIHIGTIKQKVSCKSSLDFFD